MLLAESALKRLIEAERLEYEYEKGKYLNVWHDEWDFTRLFFYITDLADYHTVSLKKPLVCDLIFQRNDENSEALIRLLESRGFVEYAVYHRWRKEGGENIGQPDMPFVICKQRTEEFYNLLCNCFDKYSDYVPEQDKLETYLQDKICYSALDAESGQTVGGMVASVKGHVYTEEFVFAETGMRRRGIASGLHDHWYKENNDGDCKFVAWIRDDNAASEKLHRKYGYEKQSSYKITFMKERQQHG